MIDNSQLHSLGLSKTATLRDYQLEGVEWLKDCHESGHGGLLCDEMGLGKTCQAICYLLSIASSERKMSLVLSPLTVLDNWKTEFERFAPDVEVTVYVGDQEQRSAIRKRVRRSTPDILLTTYDLCLRDNFFFEKRVYNSIVVDEGHRLKNSESLLYKSMETYDSGSCVILTGTPVQNNLGEMYSLLSFVHPDQFKLSAKDDFLVTYKNIKTDARVSERLQQTIKPYLLRRTKAMVALDIPEKSELTIYHPMSELQKKYYKAILMKDVEAFENENTISKTRLLNLLMQLRKCVNHPYLFDGVEPEPFKLGEHLVEASAKLVTLDKILHHLFQNGHKVLIFSQMTRMLDILQDYLHYRGYSYERLDGSVRGEERFTAIRNFNTTDDTFVFLLSSRAGGQGLNLTSADTVIFCDHDFNPQIDLQAAARAHRIGQIRPVKIIRLVSKATVEEVILSRAAEKLRLTQTVIATNGQQDQDADASTHTARDLQKMLKFGLNSLLDPQPEDDELDIEQLLGSSENNKWVVQKSHDDKDNDNEASIGASQSSQQPKTIYQYEGKDYSKDVKNNKEDDEAFQKLVDELKDEQSEDSGSRAARNRRNNGEASLHSLSLPDARTRKPLTAEQIEARRIQREKTLQRRREEAAEREKRKAEKKMEKWRLAGYTSHSVILPSGSDTAVGAEASSDEEEVEYMHFVSGDVTEPVKPKAMIVQCVDNSGEWGTGGVFSALTNKTKEVGEYYELSGDMKDLQEGDVHIVRCEDVSSHEEYYVALLVAIDKHLQVKQSLLATCLKKLAKASKDLDFVSIHLPRIGYNSKGFDWYSTERQLRKYLTNNKIHTYVYYYKRQPKRQSPSHAVSDQSEDSTPQTKKARGDSPVPSSSKQASIPVSQSYTRTTTIICDGPLENIFTDMDFVISASVSAIEKRKLTRYIIAYDGNIVPYETDNTTYTVTIEPSGDIVNSIPVQPEYVFECIRYINVIDPSDYLVN